MDPINDPDNTQTPPTFDGPTTEAELEEQIMMVIIDMAVMDLVIDELMENQEG